MPLEFLMASRRATWARMRVCAMDISSIKADAGSMLYLTNASQNYWNRKSGNLTFTTGARAVGRATTPSAPSAPGPRVVRSMAPVELTWAARPGSRAHTDLDHHRIAATKATASG